MNNEQAKRIEIQRLVEAAYKVGYDDGAKEGHEKAMQEMTRYRRAELLGSDAAKRLFPGGSHD